jgi:CheY-like chemotaxis protein
MGALESNPRTNWPRGLPHGGWSKPRLGPTLASRAPFGAPMLVVMSDPRRNERRHFARARVVATATLWVRGLCKGSYIVENLSWGGMYLSGGPAVRAGEEVKLIVELPRGPVELRGHVLRSEPRARDCALAVRFEEPSRRARAGIGAAVAEALERAAQDSSVRPEPTVLVVDDSLLVREALTRDIRCFGWEAACFSTPLDALNFLDRPKSCIRVALIDHAGPANGRDLLAYLADEWPTIRRVLLSARGHQNGDELANLASRADAVLAKPWDQETLASTILSTTPAGTP